MKLPLGLIAALLLGCTGSVETTPEGASSSGSSASAATGGADSCATPDVVFDSNMAIEQMRCSFPTYTKLELMWSSAGGDLDALGRSQTWNIRVRDAATELTVLASVIAAKGVVGDGSDPKPSSCPGDGTIPLDSAVVVPDAIARFAAHDPFVGGYTNYFLFQAAPCPSEKLKGYAKVLIMRPDPSVPEGMDPAPHSWFAHYDLASKFVKLCGPCTSGFTDDDSCPSCFD